jgi:peptidoglycan hydrolase-like amidase
MDGVRELRPDGLAAREAGRPLGLARPVLVGAAAIACFLVFAGALRADGPPVTVKGVTISGRGYGHGVGLSQWGAEQRAAAGQAHGQILSFYYPGTTIGAASDTDVRVLLAEDAELTVGSSAAFAVDDAGGRTFRLPPGRYLVSPDGTLGARRLTLPLTITPGHAPLALGTSRYHGTLTVSRVHGGLRAVNTVDLEQYVADVVSFENPAYWPQEALRAQAIASRSYALANLRPRTGFDLYPDDRSQRYAGLVKEYPSAVAATEATSGEVLRYRGRIVDAFFSASNGGVTRNTAGAFGIRERPYFRARVDSFDAHSPDSRWGPLRIRMPTLRRTFPTLPRRVVRIELTEGGAGGPASITFLGAGGSELRIDSRAFADRLGLRSPYFSLAGYA